MKSVFRIIILVMLLAIVAIQLSINQGRTKTILENAEREIAAIPVTIHKTIMQAPSLEITMAGEVNAASEVMVISQVNGKVLSLPVKVGQEVSSGTLLARIDDFFIQKEYNIAQEQVKQLETDLQRYAGLSEENAVPKQKMDQLALQLKGARTKLDALKRRLQQTRIAAPIEGTVNRIFTKSGQLIGEGSPVVEIVNNRNLIIKSYLHRDNIRFVPEGQEIRVLTDESFMKGIITNISVKPDHTGKYPIEASIEKTDDISPGMILSLEVNIQGNQSILVPVTCLVEHKGNTGVYVNTSNIAEFREVITGRYYNDQVVIIKGLHVGEDIIQEGNNLIRPGDKITIKE